MVVYWQWHCFWITGYGWTVDEVGGYYVDHGYFWSLLGCPSPFVGECRPIAPLCCRLEEVADRWSS